MTGNCSEVEGFGNLGLSSTTLRSLSRVGYEKAAPVQREAIPLGLSWTDLIIQSKSGTGKTCAFGVIVCELTTPQLGKIQSLIVAPNREIVSQIRDEVSNICYYSQQLVTTMEEFTAKPQHHVSVPDIIIGTAKPQHHVSVPDIIIGTAKPQHHVSVPDIIIGTAKPQHHVSVPDIIIGTAKQAYLLFRQRHVPMCADAGLLVLDEADVMLDSPRERKWLTYITRGLHYLCQDVKLILSSATMPPHVLPYAEDLLGYLEPKGCREFQRAALCRSDTTDPMENALLTHITHAVCVLPVEVNGDIPWGLQMLLDREKFQQCIVFCPSVELVKVIGEYLRQDQVRLGSSCKIIESSQDHSFEDRNAAMRTLRSSEHAVVVATDEVFARGVDGQKVDLVINVGLPETKETYLHRSGRCGRFGRPGTCISLLENKEELDEVRFLYIQLGVPFETITLDAPVTDYYKTNCYYFMSCHPFVIHSDVKSRERELRRLHASVWGSPSTPVTSDGTEVAVAMCSNDDTALDSKFAEFKAVQQNTSHIGQSNIQWVDILTEALVRNAISGMLGGGLSERIGPLEVRRVSSCGVDNAALSDSANANLVLTLRLLARTKGIGEIATATMIPIAKHCLNPLTSRSLQISKEIRRLLPPACRREIVGAISALQIGLYTQDVSVVDALLSVDDTYKIKEADMAIAKLSVLRYNNDNSKEIFNTLKDRCNADQVTRTGEFLAEFLYSLETSGCLNVSQLTRLLDEGVVNLRARAPMLEYAEYLPAGASIAHLLLVCFNRSIEGVCEFLPHMLAHWESQLALHQDLGPADVQCLDLVGSVPLLRCLQPLRMLTTAGKGTESLVDELMKFGARRSHSIMGLYRHLHSRIRAKPRSQCRCRACKSWPALANDLEPLVWANLMRIAMGDDEVSKAEWIRYDKSQQLNELLIYHREEVGEVMTLKEIARLLNEGADPNVPLDGRWASVQGLFPIHSCSTPLEVKLLYDSGADLNALCEGQTAADIALIRGDKETCRSLLLHGSSFTSVGIRKLLTMPRELALSLYPSKSLLPSGKGWPAKAEMLSTRAHAAEEALYKLGDLFSNLDDRRENKTKCLLSRIEAQEDTIEVKKEQLSHLERDANAPEANSREGRLAARYRRKLTCKCGNKVKYATKDCGHGICETCRLKAKMRCPGCGEAIPNGFVRLCFLDDNP